MFLPREKKILHLLYKNENKFTTSQIAAELKVSPRTIKADIKKIREILEKNSCSIKTKQGVGLWLYYDEAGEQFLQSVLYEMKDSYISSDVRKYYVAAYLLLHNKKFISMESIANLLYVSKGTIVNDVSELISFWEKFGITFIKKVKYGIKAEGSETQIRWALTDVLKKVGGKSGRIENEKIQTLFTKVRLESLKRIIRLAENRFHFVLTDISFDELLIQLAILITRVQMGCVTEPEEKKKQASEGRKAWFVSRYILEQIYEQLDVEIPESEITFLMTCLLAVRYQIPMTKEKDREKTRAREPQMFDDIMSLLQEVDEQYQLQLEEDSELACALFDHLECMVHRFQSMMYLENPILDAVKKEMFYEYEIASYLISKFGQKYGLETTEDEIGYVSFHIGAAIERARQKMKKNLSVTIICMTGIGTSQFVSMKLKRLFPEIEIKQIISGNQADSLEPEAQDFVISTVPIYKEGIEVLHVSSVLSETDIQRIRKYIQKKTSHLQEENTEYFYLKKFLNSSISIMNCDLKSKEEVIKLLGGRMISEGYVDEGYIQSVFEREELSETSVGSLVAIPHAFEGHIRKQGIGFMTLQKPIIWGSEKVQIVFMLALDAKVENNFQRIFSDVLDLTRNIKDVEQVLRAKKFSEIDILTKA